MAGEKNGDMTLMFEVVEVQDSDSNTTKEFRAVSIEVTGKEIYVGSNYKVKWKHVASLKIKNDLDERDDDDDDDDDDENDGNKGICNPTFLPEHRESDYERAGFTLVCSRDGKARKKQSGNSFQVFDPEDAANEDFRTFQVQLPVPPEGHRTVGRFWEAFCKILIGGYRKELTKRQKKKDRERARREEELQQQRQESRRRSEFSRGRTSRTYSRRPYDFMRKNAANIAHNAEVWTDDDEESQIDSLTRGNTPELVPADDVIDESVDVGDNVEIGEGDDESENEFNMDGKQIDDDENLLSSSGGNDPAEASKDQEMDDDSDSAIKRVTTKSSQTDSWRRKRIKRRAPVLDDSEDEEYDLFENNKVETTAPDLTVQRVVTPAVTNATDKTPFRQKSRVFADDDENVGHSENKDERKFQNPNDEADEELSETNNQSIKSFFQVRSKSKATVKNTESNNDAVTSVVATPTPKSIAKTLPRLGNSIVDDDDEEADGSNKEENSTKVSPTHTEVAPNTSTAKVTDSFFAPRSKKLPMNQKTKKPHELRSPTKKERKKNITKRILDDDYSDNDEVSTVVADTQEELMINNDTTRQMELTPARSSALRERNPKQNRINFDIIRMSGSKSHLEKRSIEDEDPIEEVDSSQSQSPSKVRSSSLAKRSKLSGGRLSGSAKRRRLRVNGSRSALEALEFADTKTQNLCSPVPISNRDGHKNTTRASDRSPIQPLQLGPQVEMVANNRATKWRGFRNDGNSCYINSSLQQLFSVPNFMEAISSLKKGHELTATLSDLYADLFGNNGGETQVNRHKVASARPVKTVMDRLTNRFHGCQQRDAHEFLGELIDQIHEELSPSTTNERIEHEIKDNGTSGDVKGNFKSPPKRQNVEAKEIEPTEKYFRWNIQVCLTCKTCGYSR